MQCEAYTTNMLHHLAVVSFSVCQARYINIVFSIANEYYLPNDTTEEKQDCFESNHSFTTGAAKEAC